jgi:hypothetical protein
MSLLFLFIFIPVSDVLPLPEARPGYVIVRSVLLRQKAMIIYMRATATPHHQNPSHPNPAACTDSFFMACLKQHRKSNSSKRNIMSAKERKR